MPNVIRIILRCWPLCMGSLCADAKTIKSAWQAVNLLIVNNDFNIVVFLTCTSRPHQTRVFLLVGSRTTYLRTACGAKELDLYLIRPHRELQRNVYYLFRRWPTHITILWSIRRKPDLHLQAFRIILSSSWDSSSYRNIATIWLPTIMSSSVYNTKRFWDSFGDSDSKWIGWMDKWTLSDRNFFRSLRHACLVCWSVCMYVCLPSVETCVYMYTFSLRPTTATATANRTGYVSVKSDGN